MAVRLLLLACCTADASQEFCPLGREVCVTVTETKTLIKPQVTRTSEVTVTKTETSVSKSTTSYTTTVTTSATQACSPTLLMTSMEAAGETLQEMRSEDGLLVSTPTSTTTPPLPLATSLNTDAVTTTTATNATTSTTTDDPSSSQGSGREGRQERKERARRQMSSVVRELTLDPHNVSTVRRRKESAPDERTSAQALGTGAVLFLVLVLLSVIVLDLPTFYANVQWLRRSAHAARPASVSPGP